ncbi:DUF4197 domain-containing protein [Carboxylicivirga sediminis]|uniref:DUF4197 domain-containing protein n=1 Tax=Carboxylicivirga sediminis TaxID=2006564 RepID=A0A941F3R7_9BACT|nr:DUF4197 domain-containing protein [Carboxylicivirga sediminis]MBR8535839.1 DUF4197 domain-containing protein [Carboxylicivirga sediminis]
MKKIIYILPLIVLSACAELTAVIDTYNANAPLTETEVASGLKEALRVGTDSAAARLGVTNGYYGDELVKIMLPEEADIIVKNASKIPGGEKVIEDVVVHINRAAEDAAKEAGPVFWGAIREMTIADAFNILNGENDAATQYLKNSTYEKLFNLYNPKIQASLDKEIAAGISPNMSWETLTGKWNQIADNPFGKMAGLNAVNVDLDAYLTEQALNGLFIKIAQEEAQIRKDPMARVNAILERVFGSI